MRVKLASGLFDQKITDTLTWPRGFVHAGAAKSVKHIGQRHDAALQTDYFALQSSGIAAAIPVLMVLKADACGQL